MQRSIYLFALFICVSPLTLPLVVAPALRASHPHFVIGIVTAEEMESHIESEQDHAPSSKALLTWHSGIIMNLRFGDLQSLIQITLIMVAVESLLIVPALTTDLQSPFLKPRELFLPKFDPPPRRVRIQSECPQVG